MGAGVGTGAGVGGGCGTGVGVGLGVGAGGAGVGIGAGTGCPTKRVSTLSAQVLKLFKKLSIACVIGASSKNRTLDYGLQNRCYTT